MTNLESKHYFADNGSYSQSYGFFIIQVWMWELDHKKKLNAKELMLLNYGAEDSWEPLGLQGDLT